MTSPTARLASALVLLAALACDGGKQTPAASKTPPATPSKPAADANKAPANPHAANPHAANPHAANPHAGMQAGPKPTKLGPPRDIKPSGSTTEQKLAEFVTRVPQEWEKGQPTSMMRMAQWIIPGPGGDAELVVYRFKGGAGGVKANMDRWKQQFTPPKGKTVDDLATQTDRKLAGGKLNAHVLDITGRYTAAAMPGATQKRDEADYRMLAAIIEGSGDPLFIKALGPAKTLEVWSEPWTAMLDALTLGAPTGDPGAKGKGEPQNKIDPKMDAKTDGEPNKQQGKQPGQNPDK